ncbi:MAG: hypothetical protein Q4F84_10355 [Fibrobacter sp.]|nr:hypothetical protein [Fibrobacter sp.]
MKNDKKTYSTPQIISNIDNYAAIPFLAPLAIMSAASAVAFLGGVALGAIATKAALSSGGDSDSREAKRLEPVVMT